MRLLFRSIWNVILLPFRWLRSILAEIKAFLSEEPEDTPLGDSLQKAVDNPQSLLVHVDALRRHFMRAAIVMGIVTVLAFAFATRIIDLLAYPVGGIDALVAIDPTEPIGTFMRVSLLTAFAVTLPYLILAFRASLWSLAKLLGIEFEMVFLTSSYSTSSIYLSQPRALCIPSSDCIKPRNSNS